MRRPLVRLCGALFAAATAAGCFASTQESSEPVPPPTEPPPASLEVTTNTPPEGLFYLLLQGATVNDYDLYELRFAARSVTRITSVGRVSAVGACAERIVVAAAQEEVGYSDHIQEIQGKELLPLAGLGLTEGFTPSLGTDCRVAYGWPDRSVDPPVGELRVWDPRHGEAVARYRAQPGDGLVASTAWGPGGEIAGVRTAPPDPDGDGPQAASGRAAAIIVVRSDGSVQELDPGIGQPGILVWGVNWMAISDAGPRTTVFFNHGTGERKVLPGWRPIDWSPDGRTLLVHDFASERRLGLVDESDLATVREVGVLNRAVGGGVWLAS